MPIKSESIYYMFQIQEVVLIGVFFLLFPGEIQSKSVNKANLDGLTFGLSGVKSTRS